jgi:hypothetical protein
MYQTLLEISSYSVGIGALIGLVRFKQVSSTYFPFILLLWVGLLTEIITIFSIDLFKSNAVTSNIYVLVESLLILWFFKNLEPDRKNNLRFNILALLFLAAWITDNFFISRITRFSSYFRILYSFITVLMSIHMINRLILEERSGIIKNSIFLITIGFIVFFTYKTLIEIFWVYGLNASRDFRVEVYRIMIYINLAVNLIYALAVLWIPKKREYTLL